MIDESTGSNRGIAKWVIGGILIIVAATLLNLNLLIYAIYTIAGILFLTRWISSRWTRSVVASRKVTRTEANPGDVAEVFIDVQNTGNLPVTWMLIEDMLTRDQNAGPKSPLAVKGKRIEVLKLARDERHQMHYLVKCQQRGYFQIGPLVMETGDMFGLNRRFRVLCAPDFLLVYPKIVPLGAYDISSRRPIGEVVMTHRLFEDPTRISGVRQYQRGDAMGRIHWRATARTGQLQSKTYEPSTLAGATLVIDFHQDSYDPANEPVRSELAITAAASIAAALHEMGQQCGIVSNGRDAVDRIQAEGWRGDQRSRAEARASAVMREKSDRLRPSVVPTRKSADQQLLIMRALARLEKTDGLRLDQLLIESAAEIPRDASVVVFVSRVDLNVAVTLEGLARQGYSVTAIINTHSDDEFAHAAGPLLAAGIPSSHLKDEDSIQAICEKQLIQSF